MANPIDTADKTLKRITNKNSDGDLSNYLFGKLPPQAKDLEEAVLGAMMLERDAVSVVIDILDESSFYVDAHQKIYKAMLELFHNTEPVDILTVTDRLRKNGELDVVGGAFFVTELTNRVASSANVEYHARIVSQKHIQRELIRISNEIIKDAYEDTTDVFELLDKAEKGIYSVADQNLQKNFEPMTKLLKKAIDQIEQIQAQESDLTGVPTGFTELDRLTSGFQKSDLIIVAARPGMGKTAFTLAVARNAAILGNKAIAIFSLEMSSLQLTNRLISGETELPAEKLRKGNLEPHEWTQLNHRISDLEDAKLFIDDTPAINIFQLRAKCRRLKMQHGIDMIIIDYLQLMSGIDNSKTGNRQEEISIISRSLKSIAKELEIPVIALSQLSRAVETRSGDKKPQLSDLRESGAIEQDADMVMFLYRPDYYGITEDANGQSTEGLTHLIISKHRNGATMEIPIRFIKTYAKFINFELSEMPEWYTPVGTNQEVKMVSSKINDGNDFGGDNFNNDDMESVPF